MVTLWQIAQVPNDAISRLVIRGLTDLLAREGSVGLLVALVLGLIVVLATWFLFRMLLAASTNDWVIKRQLTMENVVSTSPWRWRVVKKFKRGLSQRQR